MEFTHKPVLLDECIDALAIRPDGVYLDGTLGRAGHSLEIAKRLTPGRLICIDQDAAAIDEAALNRYYTKGTRNGEDFHTLYIGEITAAYIIE